MKKSALRLGTRTMARERPAFNALAGLVFILILGAASGLHASSLADRQAAIERALGFLQKVALDDANAAKYGADLLWCFYTISRTASEPKLSESAARMATELALRWRKANRHVPGDADAFGIYTMIAGSYTADLLGIKDPGLKAELVKAARRFTDRDYLDFDARKPPRANDPDRYSKWSDALITTYFGDAYGIRLGATYYDVVKWLPRMRPFAGHDEETDFDAFYAVTHLIYTLNGYHEHRIAAWLLPREFRFIRRKLDEAIEDEDPEMVGEALDCLKAGGFENDRQVTRGMDYLISSQLTDGTWVEPKDDVYTAYHSAWTGIDGLRDYHYHGTITKLPGNLHRARRAH